VVVAVLLNEEDIEGDFLILYVLRSERQKLRGLQHSGGLLGWLASAGPLASGP
jgi:hypothetical protein